MITDDHITHRLTRRSLLWATGGALVATGLLGAPASPASASARQNAAAGPTGWKTWYLTSPDELRPVDPGTPSQAEIEEVIAAQAAATDATTAAISRWGGRVAVLPWNDVASSAFTEFKMAPLLVGRAEALLQTAMSDAALAAWDAQAALARPSPGATSEEIKPGAGVDPKQSSFPSEHAAIAAAAAAVLTYVLPDAAPGRFESLAKEAAKSRIAAGAAFRSDIDAGIAIGEAIGAKAVARGKEDGSDAKWDGSTGRLTGDGYWEPTPPAFVEDPVFALAGTWQTWILPSGDAVRPGLPPSFDSPALTAQLAAVRASCANRTLDQEVAAHFWNGSKSGQVAGVIWSGIAADLIVRHVLDLPHATRALANMEVAMYDAGVACYDAKYTYWTARPITADPDLKVLFPTPPHPSYPSGHSTLSAAAAVTLATFFPDDESDLLGMATEAAYSRCWAGIHYPSDNDTGMTMGHTVGYIVNEAVRAEVAAGAV